MRSAEHWPLAEIACRHLDDAGRVVTVPGAHAAQQIGKILALFGDDVDDVALALQPAAAGEHCRGQHDPPLAFKNELTRR